MEKYKSYEEYIDFQKTKTLDPARRKKWLGEEWKSKIDGFELDFRRHKRLIGAASKVLCIGARTGQEVVALKNLGVQDVVGIDIVPHEPHVVLGDMHDLQFEDESFDFVYSNVIDHSINPSKMISEIERVLRVGGSALLQIQLGLNTDEFTEFKVSDPVHDILPLFSRSYCTQIGFIDNPSSINFAGMNFEMVLEKDEHLCTLHSKYSLDNITVPEPYRKIWDATNDLTQRNKAKDHGVSEEDLFHHVAGLSRRAFYLTRLAEVYDVDTIAEVGTAQGWQFYSFCEFARESPGRHVYTCDIRDVRNSECLELFEKDLGLGTFIKGDSNVLSDVCKDIKMFYIDGDHDAGAVIRDVVNLEDCQSSDTIPIWVFDDFDTRFGCFADICRVCLKGQKFKVVRVGKTASGQDNHIAIVYGRISI